MSRLSVGEPTFPYTLTTPLRVGGEVIGSTLVTSPAGRSTPRRGFASHALRGREQLAVLVLDLDRVKGINDTFGHGAGDNVLAAVGATLVTAA